MESQSPSKSLVNEGFEAWRALSLSHDGDYAPVTMESFERRMREVPSSCWSLLPFVTWDAARPIWVKVAPASIEYTLATADHGAYKGVILLRMGLGAAFFRLTSTPFAHDGDNYSGRRLVGGMTVVRYRHHNGKRWRSPKEYHKAQQAYYALRYGR